MTHSEEDPGPLFLFPGQGGYDGVALSTANRLYPQVRAVFERIDEITMETWSRSLSARLFGGKPVELAELLTDEPWVSQLAIYGAGLAAYRFLTDHGVRPSVLMGHSLGEITALVAAGAFSVEDGARIVARRTEIVAGNLNEPGAMVALALAPERAAHLVDLVDDPLLAIATENHDAQTVLSGPGQRIKDVEAIAQQLRIGCVALDTAFAFHNPALADIAPEFAAYVRGFTRQPLSVRVYSPILQRFYEENDALADLLSDHFTRPVKFSAAVRLMHGRGHRTYIESGGRAALCSIVPKALAEVDRAELTVLSTLSVGRGDALRMPDTLASLEASGLAVPSNLDALRLHLAPDATEEEFREFWAAARDRIVDCVADALRDFRHAGGAPVVEAGPEPAGAGVPSGAELMATVRSMYAQALEYPEEVFTPEALLEAELGVDSVKQVELLARVSRHYGLPERSSDFRLGDYETLGQIVGLIQGELSAAGGGVPSTLVVEAGPEPAGAGVPSGAELMATVRSMYAQALEYPEEVFTPEALLEAELGVDSVKQVELLARVSRHYGLPERSSDFRLGDYETLGQIVGLIEGELARHRIETAGV